MKCLFAISVRYLGICKSRKCCVLYFETEDLGRNLLKNFLGNASDRDIVKAAFSILTIFQINFYKCNEKIDMFFILQYKVIYCTH